MTGDQLRQSLQRLGAAQPDPQASEALRAAFRDIRSTGRMLVTLDGPCASGKTTLAGVLAGIFGAGVVHTDDFVIPHSMKTPERLRIPAGKPRPLPPARCPHSLS